MISFMTLPHLGIDKERVSNELLSTIVLSTYLSFRLPLTSVNVSNGAHNLLFGNTVSTGVDNTVVAIFCLPALSLSPTSTEGVQKHLCVAVHYAGN